jgi:4-fold beta flower protein
MMGRIPKGKAIPIYTSKGDWSALLVFPFVFNTLGEWIGWVTPDRQVYDVDGLYVGWLTTDPRILRRRTYDQTPPRKTPPAPPERVRPPATVPLPPMMSDLPFENVDVLLEEPERLHTTDTGELKQDVD